MWSNQQQNQSDVHQTGRFYINSNYNHQNSVVGSPPFIRLHPFFQNQSPSWQQQAQCQQVPHQQVPQTPVQQYGPRPAPRFHHSQSAGYTYGHSAFFRKNEPHPPGSQPNENSRPVVQGISRTSVSSPPVRASSPAQVPPRIQIPHNIQNYSQLPPGTVERYYCPTQGTRFRCFYYPQQSSFPYSRSPQAPSVYQSSPVPPSNQNVNRDVGVSSEKSGAKTSKPPTPESLSQSKTKPLYPMLTRKIRKKLDEPLESFPHYPPLPPCYNYDVPGVPYEKPPLDQDREQVIPLSDFENGGHYFPN